VAAGDKLNNIRVKHNVASYLLYSVWPFIIARYASTSTLLHNEVHEAEILMLASSVFTCRHKHNNTPSASATNTNTATASQLSFCEWHVSSRSGDGRLACKLLYPSLLFYFFYFLWNITQNQFHTNSPVSSTAHSISDTQSRCLKKWDNPCCSERMVWLQMYQVQFSNCW